MSAAAASQAERKKEEAPEPSPNPTPNPSPQSALLKEFGEVRYTVDILVGQAVRTIGQIMNLKKGDIIALDRPAHESVILSIQGIPIGLAEVVMSEKGSSIQITEVGGAE